jgi:hypothetical protein
MLLLFDNKQRCRQGLKVYSFSQSSQRFHFKTTPGAIDKPVMNVNRDEQSFSLRSSNYLLEWL